MAQVALNYQDCPKVRAGPEAIGVNRLAVMLWVANDPPSIVAPGWRKATASAVMLPPAFANVPPS